MYHMPNERTYPDMWYRQKFGCNKKASGETTPNFHKPYNLERKHPWTEQQHLSAITDSL
jgi:hypothetical protein